MIILPYETIDAQNAEQTKEKKAIWQTSLDALSKELEGQVVRNFRKPGKVNLDKIELALRQAITLGFVTGADSVVEEIVEQDSNAKEELDEPIEKFGITDFLDKVSTPRDIRGEFTGALNFFTRKRPLLKRTLNKRKQQINNLVFSVTGIFKRDILLNMQSKLTEAIKGNLTKAQFKKQAQEVSGLAQSRLETVFRTNVQSAFGAGRWEQAADPEILSYIAGYYYDSVKGKTTRETHEAFDGFIADARHKIWRHIWTPNGFNCQCNISTLTRVKAKRNGWLNKDGTWKKEFNPSYVKNGRRVSGIPSVYPKDFPDKGFKTSPGRVLSKVTKRKPKRARVRKFHLEVA